MPEPRQNDDDVPNDVLNLESASLDELERRPVCADDLQDDAAEEVSTDLPAPRGSRRCGTSRREILEQKFPPEEESS